MAGRTHGIHSAGDLLCGKLVDKADRTSHLILFQPPGPAGAFLFQGCVVDRDQVIPSLRCAKVPFHNSGYGAICTDSLQMQVFTISRLDKSLNGSACRREGI